MSSEARNQAADPSSMPSAEILSSSPTSVKSFYTQSEHTQRLHTESQNNDFSDAAKPGSSASQSETPSVPLRDTKMENGTSVDARALVRLVQCKQCSIPLRTPMTLPCGNSICPPCLPERHKRENISYPELAHRREGFICPFPGCAKEHSVADCAVDVSLSKIMDRISNTIAQHLEAHPDTPLKIDEILRAPTEAEIARTEMFGSDGRVAHSIIENGGHLAATYAMAERRQLNFDSEVVYIPQDVAAVSYRNLDTSLFAQLRHEVRQELDCQLCWNLLHDPLTTPCGHTFCRACVARILDHSTACPVCRKILHLPPGVQREPNNKLIQSLLESYCVDDFTNRLQALKLEQEEATKLVPLFVCTLAYPGMPTFLHIFEPRYRLMIRRVLDTESKTFGMATYNTTNHPQGDDLGPNTIFLRHGTLLRITQAAPLPDGRIVIECEGLSRFNVRAWHEQDGYLVAETDRIEDVALQEEERIEAEEVQSAPSPDVAENGQPDALALLGTLSTAELLAISVDFVQRMREASAPWLNANILMTYGTPPYDNPKDFPYWFASVVPIADIEKYALLGTTSVRERLKIIARWVKRIEAQRW